MRKDCISILVLPVLILMSLLGFSRVNAKESIIYGGGPFYSHASEYLELIRSSGFTTLMLWTIHVHSDGDLVYNEPKIVDNGVYVGPADWPAQVSAFKEGETSVRRIEIAIGAWGSGAFESIKNLINAEGTGPDSTLYKNFKLLKDTFPAIDGISYDDEVTYDVDSSVKFAVMLYDLGFKVTLCPYNNSNYWRNVFSQTNAQRPGAIDRVDLQCYAGGAYNNPGTWNNYFGGLRVTPGLWCYPTGQKPFEILDKMTAWNESYNIAGGFMWLFDDMIPYKDSYRIEYYAMAINLALGIDPTEQNVVTLYQHCPLDSGWSAEMGEGIYTTADIVRAGGQDNDASSMKIMPGYQVTLFSEDDFQGQSLVLRSDVDCLTDYSGWNDIVSSLVIEPIEEPVAYWKFNEGSGQTVADEGGYGFDGTIFNMEQENWVSGKKCGGLFFDGVDGFVEFNDFKGMSGRLSRTFSAWVKTSTPSFKIVNWGTESKGNKWVVQLTADGRLALGVAGGSIVGTNDLRDNLWHHIAVVLENDGSPDVSEVLLYVDGRLEPISASSSLSVHTSASDNVKLGVGFSGTALTEGAIDEVKIYSRALDAAEISQLYHEYALVGDFAADGTIDLNDFSILAYNWMDTDACNIDINCDCIVNIDDLTLLADQWLKILDN